MTADNQGKNNKNNNKSKTKEKEISLNGLERKIINECKKIATNKISHCYDLVQMTKKLIEMTPEES